MRKQLKKQALSRLKKIYWFMVVLCLIMAIAGIDYVSSMNMITSSTAVDIENNVQEEILFDIIEGKEEDSTKKVDDYIAAKKETTNNIGVVAISHSRGVFAQLVNGVSSGQVYTKIYDGIKTMTKSKTASIIFFIILSLLFIIFVNIFVLNVFKVTVRRVVMELRLYDKVPVNRFLYLLAIRRALNACATMFLTGFYQFLWMFTVVGGFIKSYSYFLVPYIVAENPTITPNRAITLSRRMMDGHKWEAFILKFSFIGWEILELFTFGLSGMLFSNPYKELTLAEYYSYLRALAKENQLPDAELLNDTYLYEKADTELLKETYSDMQQKIMESEGPAIRHTGVRGFFENVFGVNLFYDSDEKAFQDKKARQLSVRNIRAICKQEMYPFRLFLNQHKDHAIALNPVQYDRHYSAFSLIFMFFTMSFIGWCWEVSLHLISDGEFINRGFYHGPWLPIYGFGGILILMILYRFREKILLEFLSAVVLCGLVEYYTAWYMEMTHNGTKWWDYSGYFLNINGRICAEGLLVFGLGGLAIVYLLAPFLDNLFRRIPKKLSIILAVILLAVFTGDGIYSNIHPNAGEGITSSADENTNASLETNTESTTEITGYEKSIS